MTFHISETALNSAFWVCGLLSFSQHRFHLLSLNPLYSGHRACILSLASNYASALSIPLLLCPHSLQLWQVMMPGDWTIPASKPAGSCWDKVSAFTIWQKENGNKIRPKAKSGLGRSLWSCHFWNTKLSDPELSFSKINPKTKFFNFCYLRTFYFMQLCLLF